MVCVQSVCEEVWTNCCRDKRKTKIEQQTDRQRFLAFIVRLSLKLSSILCKAFFSLVIYSSSSSIWLSVWPLWWFLFSQRLLAPRLLDHWVGRDPCPASLQFLLLLPRYVNPYYPLPPNSSCPVFPIREQRLRWMVRQSTAPQTVWLMAPPFHLGRAEAPRGPV